MSLFSAMCIHKHNGMCAIHYGHGIQCVCLLVFSEHIFIDQANLCHHVFASGDKPLQDTKLILLIFNRCLIAPTSSHVSDSKYTLNETNRQNDNRIDIQVDKLRFHFKCLLADKFGDNLVTNSVLG